MNFSLLHKRTFKSPKALIKDVVMFKQVTTEDKQGKLFNVSVCLFLLPADRTFLKGLTVLSNQIYFSQITRQCLELGFIARLGRADIFHQAAIEAGVGLRGIADDKGSAGQLDQPGAQLQGLTVFLPPGEGHQIRVDLARHHLTVPKMHSGGRRLAGEPGHP